MNGYMLWKVSESAIANGDEIADIERAIDYFENKYGHTVSHIGHHPGLDLNGGLDVNTETVDGIGSRALVRVYPKV